MRPLSLVVISLVIASTIACDLPPPDQRQIQAQKAYEAAQSINYSENAEIDNIKRRLELTSNPGQMGYVLLINEMGQPIMYTTVRGKITSGGKHLRRDCDDCPSDEGTFGHSGEYVYFWTESGQYVQYNGKYVYSDKPLRLDVKPLVVDVVSEE